MHGAIQFFHVQGGEGGEMPRVFCNSLLPKSPLDITDGSQISLLRLVGGKREPFWPFVAKIIIGIK